HKKLQRQRITVEQVYDLCAMRVITRSVQDCYAVLGIIHNLWRPVPGRIKDFIAMPRPNFYQSLHTSVIAENGTPFEVQIRTEEGHSCVGAKVNGRMVPLRHKLHSGDIVEILTQLGHKPSRDWLAVVKSSRARNKIKHWLNVHQRERAIEIGRKLIEKEARKYRISLKEIKDQELQRVASDYGLGRPEDLMAGIGYGKYSARQALARLVPAGSEPITEGETPKASSIASVVRRVFGGDHNNNAIRVKGHGDLLVYRARCCNPIRGENVVGYVTRGKGVAVHAANCSNVVALMYEPERKIEVEWARDDGTPSAYPVKLTVFCD